MLEHPEYESCTPFTLDQVQYLYLLLSYEFACKACQPHDIPLTTPRRPLCCFPCTHRPPTAAAGSPRASAPST